MPSAAAKPAATGPVVVQAKPLLVRAETAAAMLGISTRTFERLWSHGRLPEPLRLGRARVWSVADLEHFVVAGCRREATQ